MLKKFVLMIVQLIIMKPTSLMYTPIDELQCHQTKTFTRHGPSKVMMDKATWLKLPKTDKEAWDKISDDGKMLILKYNIQKHSQH